jgi:hypothetical protein
MCHRTNPVSCSKAVAIPVEGLAVMGGEVNGKYYEAAKG